MSYYVEVTAEMQRSVVRHARAFHYSSEHRQHNEKRHYAFFGFKKAYLELGNEYGEGPEEYLNQCSIEGREDMSMVQ